MPSFKQPPKMRSLILALGAVTVIAGSAAAQTAEEKGLAIAREMDARDIGWNDSRTVLKMVLRNRNGDTSTRDLHISNLEVSESGLGDKSLVVFDRPKDVDGTAFLSHTKILEADDQWLFLPALKRVKRISSANKSGPFIGSELAYEDMLSQEVEKYNFKWLQDEACGDLTCFVVERIPVYENSGYTRQIMWVDQDEYRVMKIDFYDRKDSLLKTLVQSEFEVYLDTYWRPHRMEMENHQTGKSTTLTFEAYEFQVGLEEGDFTANRLKRAR